MMIRLKHAEPVMGTVVSFDVDSAFGAAVGAAVRWLHWVDATFSTFRADSEVSRLGRGEIALGQCSARVREVIAACAELTAVTGGYFSATAGAVLDPSGYVKGWAVERAAAILTEAGSLSHCVNGGGDVRCVGSSPRGGNWRIGIADPVRHGALALTAEGRDFAVATSGIAERGEHVLDPHTRTPPQGLLSITVTGPELALADAYATAVFAMGFPRAMGFPQAVGFPEAGGWSAAGYEAFGITDDGRTWQTPGFPAARSPLSKRDWRAAANPPRATSYPVKTLRINRQNGVQRGENASKPEGYGSGGRGQCHRGGGPGRGRARVRQGQRDAQRSERGPRRACLPP
ncbi:MAG TPA: FAD:protein FMN transferase [Streptosporangiaceae bacterium]